MEPEGMLKGWNRNVRMTTAMISAWKMTRMVSAKPPSRRLRALDTLVGLLMPRSATLVFHCFDWTRASAFGWRMPPIRGPEGNSGIRGGRSGAAGRRRFSGSDGKAQRTRCRPSPAVAIVMLGHAVDAALGRELGGAGREGNRATWLAPHARTAHRRDCVSIKPPGDGIGGRRAAAGRDLLQKAPPKRGPSQGGNAPRGASAHYLSRRVDANDSSPLAVWVVDRGDKSNHDAVFRRSRSRR